MPTYPQNATAALKIAAMVTLVPSVGSCITALPPAVQVASLAFDGISFASTGKTMSDHAISAVTAQDCAMVRALRGQAVCARDAQLAELEEVERRLNGAQQKPGN